MIYEYLSKLWEGATSPLSLLSPAIAPLYAAVGSTSQYHYGTTQTTTTNTNDPLDTAEKYATGAVAGAVILGVAYLLLKK